MSLGFRVWDSGLIVQDFRVEHLVFSVEVHGVGRVWGSWLRIALAKVGMLWRLSPEPQLITNSPCSCPPPSFSHTPYTPVHEPSPSLAVNSFDEGILGG